VRTTVRADTSLAVAPIQTTEIHRSLVFDSSCPQPTDGDFVDDGAPDIEYPRRARRHNRYVPSRDELRYGFRAYLISHVCRIVALCVRCSVPIAIVWVVGQAWIARTALLAGRTTSAKIDEGFSIWTNLLEPLADEIGSIEWVAGVGLVVAIAAIALRAEADADIRTTSSGSLVFASRRAPL